MAFGRSNSLSLNTGATNLLFNQQNQQNQPNQGASLFGANNTSSSQPSGGLFGASTAAGQAPQAASLFGGNAGTTAQQNSQQQSGGLFGGGLGNQTQQNQNQQITGNSLFGNQTQQNQNQQNAGSSLFGNLGQNQNNTQTQQSGGLFGGLGNQNKPAGTSLFGNSTAQQPANNQQQPSLFGTSIFNNSTSNATEPRLGLTMGQGQPQQQTVPGVKVDISNVRPTTRFSDLHDDLKKTIEHIDGLIKQQESYASQCEAMLPTHAQSVASVTPDVELIAGKVETVELALENDSRDIKAAKDLATGDVRDLTRCARVIENLSLPSQFHYGPSAGGGGSRNRAGDEDYDVDILGYFSRQAEEMQQTLATFTSNLTEIESHLRVIEASTVQQAHQVAAQRAGGSGGSDTVRELADTLRGFENGILDAAGFVGACREGVNELILGRVGDGRASAGFRRY